MTSKQPFSEVAGKIAVITGAARGLGQGTAEIAEAGAFALQVAHGIGITHWGKPVISRFFSFDHPEVIEEGMVMAIETYCGEGNDAARIEEQFVVTKDGVRQQSKFPSENLLSCPCVGALLPGMT